MHEARFSEGQITYALKQVESGKLVGEVCRQIGVPVWEQKIASGRIDNLFPEYNPQTIIVTS